MIIRAKRNNHNHYAIGISLFTSDYNWQIYVDLIFGYVAMEYRKKGYGHEQSKYN